MMKSKGCFPTSGGGICLLAGLLVSVVLMSCKSVERISTNRWALHFSDGVNINCDGQPLLRNVVAEYRHDNRIVRSTDYRKRRFCRSKINDKFGHGDEWQITFEDSELPRLTERFRIYKDYILTEVIIEGADKVRLNYIAPVVTHEMPCIVRTDWRRLFVPFDNDAWVRYRTSKVAAPMRSYEVTALYDAESRKGFVVGAISHDKWKNAIDLDGDDYKLHVFSGVADSLTRDVHEHGFVEGQRVCSATIFIGVFDDWRRGLETFADANATMEPRREWTKGMPVGWNSWGALAFRVNHKNATEVVSFLADSLQRCSFQSAEGLLYTGLDSGWNNFSEAELKDFADRCHQCNQVAGIYWTPFTDWSKDEKRRVPGAEEYCYGDIWLRADGKPQELDGAYALDPTHPAVRAMMENTAELFRRCGFEYVKMDFMTHGRMEADSWQHEGITTGTEAYNYGMHLLDSIFSDFYINLSISPIFPAQYAQSRRIACDAWNKIKDTEYTMNALSWGWWIDRIYQYNDADHVVLRDATEGENRARITSSVITGLYVTGDDFSHDGDATAKMRARQLLTNSDINGLASGRSFHPLTGDSDEAEYCFVRKEPDGSLVLAVFNYGDHELSIPLPLRLMGLKESSRYSVTELWTHQPVSSQQLLQVPAKDVRVYRISE